MTTQELNAQVARLLGLDVQDDGSVTIGDMWYSRTVLKYTEDLNAILYACRKLGYGYCINIQGDNRYVELYEMEVSSKTGRWISNDAAYIALETDTPRSMATALCEALVAAEGMES